MAVPAWFLCLLSDACNLLSVHKLFLICKILETATESGSDSPTTINDIETSQELSAQDVTCAESELESQCESVICISSDEEQPDSSDLPREQQSTPKSSVPKPSVSHTVSVVSEMSIDIGNIITPSKSVDEICLSMKNSEKYSLLFHHVKPPSVLPTTFSHGCNRKFNNDWLTKYPWLKYSPKLDAVFCGPCAVLLDDSRKDKGVLVNKSFSKWVKLSETLSNHAKLAYHHDCLQAADILKTSIEKPASRIDVMTNQALQSRMAENKQILCQIVRAIIFLGKQGLGLRGDVENVTSEKNPGNFLALLKVFAENDSVLYRHLHQPRAKNVTYLSLRHRMT